MNRKKFYSKRSKATSYDKPCLISMVLVRYPEHEAMADFSEKLCEAVKKFPCVWDTSSRSFKDNTAKTNTWKTIADEVSLNNYEAG